MSGMADDTACGHNSASTCWWLSPSNTVRNISYIKTCYFYNRCKESQTFWLLLQRLGKKRNLLLGLFATIALQLQREIICSIFTTNPTVQMCTTDLLFHYKFCTIKCLSNCSHKTLHITTLSWTTTTTKARWHLSSNIWQALTDSGRPFMGWYPRIGTRCHWVRNLSFTVRFAFSVHPEFRTAPSFLASPSAFGKHRQSTAAKS